MRCYACTFDYIRSNLVCAKNDIPFHETDIYTFYVSRVGGIAYLKFFSWYEGKFSFIFFAFLSLFSLLDNLSPSTFFLEKSCYVSERASFWNTLFRLLGFQTLRQTCKRS